MSIGTDHETEAIRRLAVARGEDTTATLRASAEGIAARLRGTQYDPSTPNGPKPFALEILALGRRRWDCTARAAYLEAGADGPFVADDAGRERAAGHDVVRCYLRSRFPDSIGDFLERAQGALGRWRGRLAPIRMADGSVKASDLDADVQRGRINPGDYHDKLTSRMRAIEDETSWLEALSAALVALPDALAGRIAAAVASSGGAGVLAEALRESAMLSGSPYQPDPAGRGLDADRARLDDLDARLAKLGIPDPAKLKAAPPGLAAAALWNQRRDLSASVRRTDDEILKRLETRCAGTVADASAGDLAAWQLIRVRAKLTPSAFPPGFVPIWDEAVALAFGDAGPEAFAGVLYRALESVAGAD